jgi:uncharacterized protein YodC (DUF2158 family)
MIEKRRKNGMKERKSKMNLGDVVTLKSGGPKMTLGFKTPSGAFRCYWFEEIEMTLSASAKSWGELRDGVFKEEALTMA